MTASTAITRWRGSTASTTARSRRRQTRRGEAWDLRHMSRLRAQFSRREPWSLRLLRTLFEDRSKATGRKSFTPRDRLTA